MTAVESFEYLGYVFEPIRDFTAAEESYENLSRRTKGFKSVISIEGYSHAAFYKIAQASNAFLDLYAMNGSKVVVPGLNGFYEYDLSVPLLIKGLPFYSECCGGIVEPVERQQSKKAGPYICPMCKRPVTMAGRVKKLKKEA